MSGTLSLQVICGRGLRETGVLTKQDLYIVVTAGGNKARSKTCQGAGSDPNWNEMFTFPLHAHDHVLTLEIWSAKMLGDSKTGVVTFSLSEVRATVTGDKQLQILEPSTQRATSGLLHIGW
eukprot:CAMPEP_0197861750 /NCGR_PEP_ID=MMETSP1438-20131217/38004_1 /TAXON_ID=1461541 /ORGANISM="Pterosperma sp., Strain CCMP1384" /LENGTH=120 /DNA_ID=CAMNT_0043479035 /DNA_START=353 /DNA_END=712 /DNA_ORIENTATION=+